MLPAVSVATAAIFESEVEPKGGMIREYVGTAAYARERRRKDRKRPRIILIELGCVQLDLRCGVLIMRG